MTDTTDKPSLEEIAEKDTAAKTKDREHSSDTTSKTDVDEKGDATSAAPTRKSGGGFVWFVLLLVVAGGSVAAGWPYIGPRVEPMISDARDLLGLSRRPTQAQEPSDSLVYAPPVNDSPVNESPIAQAPATEPMPSVEAPADQTVEATPEPNSDPVVSAQEMPPVEQFVEQSVETPVETAGDLAQRLSVLENQIQTLSAISGTEGQAAVEATADLARALSGLKNEIADLSQRISALEDGARADPTAPAQALVLGVTQLRSQLLGDGAFAAELQALESIARGDQVVMEQVQRLRPHAEVGVPSEAALTARFAKVAKAIVSARTSSEADGWLATVKNSLGGLVTVRRTDPASITDQVERAVAVAEAALELGELADAVNALSTLDGAPSEAAAAWLGDARARVDAEAALQALHQHALSVLAAAGGA